MSLNSQRDNVKLSVVIPTLTKIETARSLARRLSELLEGLNMEVIIVSSCTDASVDGPGVRIRYVSDERTGIYAAYACGMSAANGEYVWFMGDDDYPLDSVTKLIPVFEDGHVDLIICPVIYSSGKLYWPRRTGLGLLLRNWCQQGVIYKRTVLSRHRFYGRLRVQADHYVNVLLNADRSLEKLFFDLPISVFGAHGLSSNGGDEAFRRLRPILAHHSLTAFELFLFDVFVRPISTIKRALSRAK
jgi:glycosyltransferase involved in cell wall biosynthesis